MSKIRWSALGLLLLAVGCIPKKNQTSREDTTPNPEPTTVSLPTEVVEALTALELPSPPRGHINDSPVPDMSFQPRDYYEDCPDAIDLLSKTPIPVDAELLRLAQSDKPLPTRYRAATVLAHRKNQAVVPILHRMCAADDVLERYVAWCAYDDAVGEKQIPPPVDVTDLLALYKKERDHEVHQVSARFLGTARCRDAVPVLIDTLRTNPSDYHVVWALGMIGDPQAVPVLIAMFEKSDSYRSCYCEALGKLATPQAVDFLIAHLDTFGAVEAVAETKSPKALPPLQQHLDKLTRAKRQDELQIALTKVAMTELSYSDPAPHLLAFAEDRANSDWLRIHALWEMEKYETAPLHPRLLRMFLDDPDLDVKRFCVYLLKNSSLEGVTEAVIERTLKSEESGDYREQGLQRALLSVVNERLGYSYRDMQALQERLRSRPNDS